MIAFHRKLVLYSGGQTNKNYPLHQALVDLVDHKRQISMTYIPYCYSGHKKYYLRAVNRYKKFGIKKFHCMPVDRPISTESLKKTLNSDIIYLAGGNTFYFLMHLQKSKMLKPLYNYVKAGGVLAGLSAGALIMTPDIRLAGYPSFDCDDNEVGLKNLKALGLVEAEFFPHLDNSKRLHDALLKYSKKSHHPLFACEDGGGLVIDGHRKTFFGKSCFYVKGHRMDI